MPVLCISLQCTVSDTRVMELLPLQTLREVIPAHSLTIFAALGLDGCNIDHSGCGEVCDT